MQNVIIGVIVPNNIYCFQFNTSYTSKQMKSYEIHQEGIKKTLKDIITEIEEKGDLCYIPPSNKTVRKTFSSKL